MMSQLADPSPVVSSAGEHALYLPLAPMPPSGHMFDIARRLSSVDMDENQFLRVDGIARLLQDAGADHLICTGAMRDHPHWVVRRTVIDVIRPITWPAELRVRRWCSALSSRWCAMRVRIDSDTGGQIETEGFWIHMNKQTMSPSRVSDQF
jgi:acyl-ACP thioesterase